MKRQTQSFYELAVRRAVERVVSELDQALDLHALAKGAALSPFHFHRVFRGMLGETPLELQRRLRLERAACSLVNEDVSVTTVAFAAGYETHESFTRAFRAHYACSPSEFRQRALHVEPGCSSAIGVELPARSGIHFPDRLGLEALQYVRGETTMEVIIKQMDRMRVFSVRHVGPYNRISEAFARLGAVAGQAQLFGPESAMVGIYHDDPESTPAAELRSDAGLVVSGDRKLPEGLDEQWLAEGRYATTLHIGSYKGLGDTWARLMGEWLPKSGERLAQGVSYEIYRNAPGDVPEAELRTELYMPLAD